MYWHTATANQPSTQLLKIIREVGEEGYTLTEIDMHYFSDYHTLIQAKQALIQDHYDPFVL